MIERPTRIVAVVFSAAAMLLSTFAAKADIRAPTKPLATRVQEADKVFVGVLINRKLLEGDWCHADLKVTQAIKGCEIGELVPVLWRPMIARYDAKENQKGLALLKPTYEKRYWLRSDTFEDAKLTDQAVKLLGGQEFEREYVQQAVLSKEQEKIVIELAQRHGIKKVTKISTYNLYPTAARGITVKGVDQVKGREVSRRVLQVRYKDWWNPKDAPRKGDLRIGDFWAGKPTTRQQTILKVGKKEYRTGTIQGLSIEECESVLGRFLDGKYTFGPGLNEDSLDQVDWSQPQGFRKRGDQISVSFNHKSEGGGFYELEVLPTNDKLVISQVLRAIP